MKMVRFLFLVLGFLLLHGYCQCQEKNDTIPSFIKGKPVTGARVADTLPPGPHPKGHKEKPYQVDTLAARKHNPRKATLYSTFFPGLGQIYNRKYWKLPLVYAAVGIPAYTFFYNHNLYQQCQQAIALIDPYTSIGVAVPDNVSSKISNPALRYLAHLGDANSIRTYPNSYRKNQDYSVIFFLFVFGRKFVAKFIRSMKIGLIGYGKMGRAIEELAVARGHAIVLKISAHNPEDNTIANIRQADVAIEFTGPESAYENILRCQEAGVPVVCGSTGWLDKLEAAKTSCLQHNGALLYASNFSVGVNIFFEVNKRLAALMAPHPDYAVRITEIHHTEKKDASSGTATTMAGQILEKIHRK